MVTTGCVCMVVCEASLIQIEQEMVLVMKTSISDPKPTFHTQWTTVYVPAILSYGDKIKKKNITSLLAVMNRAGK